jgi:RIO kinase 2
MDAVKAAEGEDGSEESENDEDMVSGSESDPGSESSRPTSPSSELHEEVASLTLNDPLKTNDNSEPLVEEQKAGELATGEAPDVSEESEEEEDEMKMKVATEIGKTRAHQQRKYHSKKSTGRAGRAKGSKAKQDTRVKLNSGEW